MIDAFAILVSTILVVFVVFRAYIANRKETWFTATPPAEPPKAPPTLYRRNSAPVRRS
jgi:hypothetical protein